jgi:hypothetical protein
MSRYAESFKNCSAVFLVAIHVGADDEAWASDIEIARNEGADGIFVIRDGMGTNEDALGAYKHARGRYPRWWIGLNLLGYHPLQAALQAPIGTSGVWFDQSGLEGLLSPSDTPYLADVRLRADVMHLEKLLLFPSVAMKYRPQPEDLSLAAQLVAPYADCIITSGEKTGEPPTIEKMRTLRQAVSTPIGIASGIDTDNVRPFLDVGVNVFIVNTSISSNGRLDDKKVHALRMKIPRR